MTLDSFDVAITEAKAREWFLRQEQRLFVLRFEALEWGADLCNILQPGNWGQSQSMTSFFRFFFSFLVFYFFIFFMLLV